jgi:Tfp pilus assembly PilM family ATPase
MATLLERLKGLTGEPRRFAAVDCDGRHIRVVYAERWGRSARVLKTSALAIPPGTDSSDPRQLGVLLGQVLRDMRLGGVGLLMNVTRAEAVLKPVTLPPGTSQNELAGMVSFQVEKELPFRSEEAVIDFTIESHYDAGAGPLDLEASRGTDVLVGAVRLPVVDHYRRIAEAAGARLLRLGLRPYANVRCVNACKPGGPHETVLLVHLGAEETEIDLLAGGSLVFSRSAAVKIPPADAPSAVVAESLRAVAMEVRRSVQSYLAVEREFKIDKIVIAGGTGVEAAAADELSTGLKAPCELLKAAPMAGFGDPADTSAFISALGLVIGHSGLDRLPFDFLHPKRHVEPRNKARTMAIAAAAVLLAAAVAGGTAGAIQVSGRKEAAEQVQRKLLAEKENEKSLLHIARQVKALQQWQDERRDWLAHWARLSALFPGAPDAYISGIKTVETSGEWSLSFVVKARDSKIITDLGDRLEAAGYKFQPGGLTTTPDPYGYQYSEELRVFIEPDMELDLANAKSVDRPADDDSIRQLAKASAAEEAPAPAAPAPTAASGTPAEGGPDSSSSNSGRSGKHFVLTDEVKQELKKEVLARFDRNHDGKLDGDERRAAYQYIKEGKYMRYFDADHNGKLDSKEYAPVTTLLGELR